MIKSSALSNLLKKAIDNGIDTVFISKKFGNILCIEGNDNNPLLNDVISSMWTEYEPTDESPLKDEKLKYLLIENDDSNVIMTNIYNYIICMKANKDLEKSYLEAAEKYNFTYNESLIGTQGQDKHYKHLLEMEDEEIMKLYNKYNPVLILNETTHKTAIIIYRFVIMKVVQTALDNLFDAIHIAFEDTIRIGLIINIVFIYWNNYAYIFVFII